LGEQLSLTLTAPYTGPFNVPILFNKEFYQPISGGTSSVANYGVFLTNQNDTSATEPAGSQIVIKPAFFGTITGFSGGTGNIIVEGLNFHKTVNGVIMSPAVPSSITSGTFVTINGNSGWKISGFANGRTHANFDIHYPQGSPEPSFSAGDAVFNNSNTSPNVIVGTTNAVFTVPAIGSTVTVQISSPYTGASGQTVFIGNFRYSIAPAAIIAQPPKTTGII